MASQTYSTEVEVKANSSAAEASLDRMIGKAQRLRSLLGSLPVGVGGAVAGRGGPGAPPIPNPDGAAPAPPAPAPSAGTGAPAAPAPAPSAGAPDARGRALPSGAQGGMGVAAGFPGARGGVIGAGGMSQFLADRVAALPAATISALGGGVGGVLGGLGQGARGLGDLGRMAVNARINRFAERESIVEMREQLQGSRAGRATLSAVRGLGAAARALPWGLGTVAGATFAMGQTSLAQRMALIGQAQGIERADFALQAMRSGLTPQELIGAGASFGMGPSESVNLYRGLFGAIGARGGGGFESGLARAAMRAQMEGVGLGPMAAFLQLGRPGGGANFNVEGGVRAFSRARGAAQGLGLAGSGEAAFITGLTGLAAGRAEAGMMTNVNRLTDFAYNVGQGRGGARGMGGVRAARGMLGIGQRALGQFSGMFGGLAESAVLAQALEGGGDPMEVMSRLARISGDPYAIRGAVTGVFGENAGLALAGAGLSPDLARGILGAGRGGAPELAGISEARLQSALPISRASAEREGANLAEVLNNPEWAAELLRIQGALEKEILKLTGEQGYARDILKGIETMTALFGDMIQKTSETYDTIRRLL